MSDTWEPRTLNLLIEIVHLIFICNKPSHCKFHTVVCLTFSSTVTCIQTLLQVAEIASLWNATVVSDCGWNCRSSCTGSNAGIYKLCSDMRVLPSRILSVAYRISETASSADLFHQYGNSVSIGRMLSCLKDVISTNATFV